MNGYEWPKTNKMSWDVPILFWQRRKEIVLQRPGHDNRNSNLLLLDGCEVTSADLASNPPSDIVAIYWPMISMVVYRSDFKPH